MHRSEQATRWSYLSEVVSRLIEASSNGSLAHLLPPFICCPPSTNNLHRVYQPLWRHILCLLVGLLNPVSTPVDPHHTSSTLSPLRASLSPPLTTFYLTISTTPYHRPGYPCSQAPRRPPNRVDTRGATGTPLESLVSTLCSRGTDHPSGLYLTLCTSISNFLHYYSPHSVMPSPCTCRPQILQFPSSLLPLRPLPPCPRLRPCQNQHR